MIISLRIDWYTYAYHLSIQLSIKETYWSSSRSGRSPRPVKLTRSCSSAVYFVFVTEEIVRFSRTKGSSLMTFMIRWRSWCQISSELKSTRSCDILRVVSLQFLLSLTSILSFWSLCCRRVYASRYILSVSSAFISKKISLKSISRGVDTSHSRARVFAIMDNIEMKDLNWINGTKYLLRKDTTYVRYARTKRKKTVLLCVTSWVSISTEHHASRVTQ